MTIFAKRFFLDFLQVSEYASEGNLAFTFRSHQNVNSVKKDVQALFAYLWVSTSEEELLYAKKKPQRKFTVIVTVARIVSCHNVNIPSFS